MNFSSCSIRSAIYEEVALTALWFYIQVFDFIISFIHKLIVALSLLNSPMQQPCEAGWKEWKWLTQRHCCGQAWLTSSNQITLRMLYNVTNVHTIYTGHPEKYWQLVGQLWTKTEPALTSLWAATLWRRDNEKGRHSVNYSMALKSHFRDLLIIYSFLLGQHVRYTISEIWLVKINNSVY